MARKASKVPNKLKPKRSTPRPFIIKMVKVKDKERPLKQQEKNNLSHTRESP